MKTQYLFLSFVCVLLAWIRFPCISILFLICTCIYHLRKFKRHHIAFMVLCILFFLRIQIPIKHNIPTSYIVQIQEIKQNYAIASVDHQKVIIYGMENPNYQDVYEVRGTYEEIDTVHNQFQFNFKEYSNKRNIRYSIQVKSSSLKSEGTSLRHHLYQNVMEIQDVQQQTFLKAMIFGIQVEDDSSFFLISSGMHIAFLFHIIQIILHHFMHKDVAQVICFVLICLLSYATILSSSLLRIMCFQAISIACKRMDTKNRLGCSMILTLLLAPYMANELSFVLPVSFRLISLFNIAKRKRLLLTLITIIPIQLYFFHSFNVLQILLFAILRIVYACFYGVAFLLLCGISIIPQAYLQLSLSFLRQIESFGYVVYGRATWIWLLLWIYVCICIVSRKQRVDILKLGICLLGFFLLPYINPFAKIMMMDVGQGDSTFIFLPFHQGVYMVDVMGHQKKNIPKDIIVPILHSEAYTSIDMLLITHQDFDHSGGLQQLQDEVVIKELITTKQMKQNVNHEWMKLMLTNYQGKDENDNSIVSMFKLYDTTLLCMGDLGIDGEKQLLQEYPLLESDVLKVGHHGSNTSSSLAFTHQIHPRIALISSGRKNRYGHPHQETLKHLNQEDSKLFITAKQGSITIYSLPHLTVVRSDQDEIGWFIK